MLLAQITDTHISRDVDFLNRRIDPAHCLERAVDAVLRLQPAPDAVLLTGDIVEHGDPQEYAVVAQALARLPMPVFAVPGNHDLADTLRGCLPRYVPAQAEGHASYVVEAFPVRLIGLDTAVPGHSSGALDATRLAWLAEALAQRPGVPVLIFMHHPPIETGLDRMDRCGLLEGVAELRALVEAHGAVQGIVCGHVHRSIQGMLGHVPVRVANSSAHQIALDLMPGAPLAFVLEPPCITLHRLGEHGMVSHVAYVEPFPGPWRF